MKKQNNLTETIKIRVTPEEKQALTKVAQKENITLSSTMRSRLFSTQNIPEDVFEIQRTIGINQVYNLIAALQLPQNIKDTILEEVSHLG